MLYLVPNGKVQNLTVVEVTSRELIISWGPPAASLQNGEIIGYRVVTMRESVLVSNSTTASLCHSLTDLYPHVSYSVSVSPINSIGEGPSLSISQLTDSEGIYIFVII